MKVEIEIPDGYDAIASEIIENCLSGPFVRVFLRPKKRRVIKFTEVDSFEDATEHTDNDGSRYGIRYGRIDGWHIDPETYITWLRREETFE
jgi:hypothetical protein